MGIYQNLYDLIVQYIYGGVELTPNMEIVTVLISTIGCLFVIAIPFLVTWYIIRTLTSFI